MAISAPKSPPFGVGEKLTSTILNAINTALTFALDKRTGQTDTLESIVSAANAGRLVKSSVVGADADTTYALASGLGVIRLTSAITANRAYTLSNTAAINGDEVTVYAESSAAARVVTVKNGAGTALITVGTGEAAEALWATFRHNGTAWQLMAAGLRAYPTAITYTANGTYTVPNGVRFVLVDGCGGGGGGGAAYKHNAAGTNLVNCGGGGGGGALRQTQWIPVVPGEALAVVVGAAGAAGSVGLATIVSGGDGGDTTVIGSIGSVCFNGAQGGRGGYNNLAASTTAQHIPGGAAVRGGIRDIGNALTPGSGTIFPRDLSAGGWGGGNSNMTAAAIAGGMNPNGGFSGGVGGSPGSNSGSYYGGGEGGGGGAGPYGAGGAGGVGGAGNNAGAGSAGASGGPAAVNTGAGGGGGAGGGQGSGGVGNSGSGGAGGSGRVSIIPLRH